MKFFNYSITAIVLFLPSYCLGQFTGGKVGSGNPLPVNGCGHDLRHEQMLQTDAAFVQLVNQINQNALNYANSDERNDDEIFTIPVVVHVIHLGEPVGTGSNISDVQIQSAIVALNNDFRKVPGTVGDANGVDTGLEFCLAMRNPSGGSTSGIVRVDGRVVPLYETQGISAGGSLGANEGAVKALSTWPKTEYVNIWVVSEIEDNNAGNGIQGYAYFPTSSALDGIVLLHNVFGTVGNVKPTHNLSRTTTHEMGHTFALYHTFHQSGNCDAEIDCAIQGDRVCDTPKTIQNANCSNPACSGTQQVNNYLDYTSQTCRNMFSEGQKIRMRSTLFNERASLLTSMGCVPPSQFDIGISNVTQPTGSSCNSSVTPAVTLVNYGGVTITSATIHYHINGMVFGTFNWTGSLAQGAQIQVTLPSLISPFGTNTIYCYTENPNGQQDEYSGNDQAMTVFTIVNGTTYTVSANLDFFGGQNTWEIKNAEGATVAIGGPYPNNQQGSTHTNSACLPEGCYTFHFYDSGGNGMSFLAGSYQLLGPGGAIVASGSGNFGSSQTHSFCVEAPATWGGTAPSASFTQNTTQICQGGSIQFTNQSTGSPISYAWSFPGGTPSTSTAVNPTVTYGTSGSYSVTLIATNASGSNTFTQNNLIVVSAAPIVNPSTTNVTCHGANNGMATLNVSGNHGPFTTTWSNGQTGNSISGLANGSYTATTSNSLGCSTQTTISITQPTALGASASSTQPSCAGSGNGSATATATGGTGNKTFAWSNGQTGASATNLAPGSYTVTATDANGCTAQASVSITAPPTLTVSASAIQPTCSNSNNGSATATATGGTGSKTFVWSNGQTGATANNLAAGSYTVTATDANGCAAQSSVTIISPAALSVTTSSVAPSCSSSNNGSATATASGGTGNKTFSWSNGQTGATAGNLTAGSYTVTATDANGCTAQSSVTISAPAALSVSATASHPTCATSNNGGAVATATGGTGSKTFSWSNGQSGSSASNLTPGTHTVTATDANGCAAQTAVTITAPQPIIVSIAANQITCGSENNGSMTVSATGGTGQKTFVWNTGQTGSSISNLEPGMYSVTATDFNGCSAQASAEIDEPVGFVISTMSTNVTCHGAANGTATITQSGGMMPIVYQWTNGQTGASISGLAPGVHSVTATDSNGCTAQTAVGITQPSVLNISATATQIACFGGVGSATATSTGGTGQKTFTWSTGQSGPAVANLPAGNHTVIVTDANGCTKQTTVNIVQPPALTISTSSVNVSCFGANNGTATASATGGTGSISLAWSNGQSGGSATGLAPGNHTVTATDANNCATQANVTITQPAQLIVSASATQVTCNGANNGTATAAASGGTGSKTFLWNNGQGGASISGLSAGAYTVTATDANGCSAQATATVSQNSDLTVSISASEISCPGSSNGSLSASASGGSGTLTYIWSNGQSGQTIQNLGPGNYSITVSDINGCSFTANASLEEPAPIVINFTSTDPSCGSTNNGSATASATGGSGNKTFAWSNGQSGPSAAALGAGTYTVTATDSNGCSAQASVTLVQSASMALNLNTTQPSCLNPGAGGSISASTTGANGNVSFTWSNGMTGNIISDLEPGIYSVIASDQSGCTAQASAEILDIEFFSISASSNNVTCHGAANGSATVIQTGGTPPISYQWANGQSGANITGLAPGIHTVTATDALGCTAQTAVGITQPPILTVNASVVNSSCSDLNNGSAIASAAGGTGQKTFTWSTGQTGTSIQNLAPGSYSVTVSDVNGCAAQSSFSIAAPMAISASLVTNNALCFGESNGSAVISATGGTGALTFLWSNGQTGPSAQNLAAGNYTVTTSDANGCSIQSSFSISQPEVLIVTASASSLSCAGGADASASAVSQGGTGVVSYQWSNGLTGAQISSLPSGVYSVTATDQNGCLAMSSATVTAPAPLTLQTIASPAICFGEASGSATVSSNGGTGNVSFVWNNGQTGASATALAAGNYTVTASDANGCQALAQVVIGQPVGILLSSTVQAPTCFGLSNGTASASASGGNGTIDFQWSNGQTGATATNLSAGNYLVTATDNEGCSMSAPVIVSQPGQLNLDVIAFDISCGNGGGGLAAAMATGGSEPYNYSWSNGNQGDEADNLPPGDYSVTVTDLNGCSATASFNIGESATLSVGVFAQNPSCFGGSDGHATAIAVGGLGPYTYYWDLDLFGADVSGLTAGVYTVYAADVNGCAGSMQVALANPPILVATAAVTSPQTCTESGSAVAVATGGTGILNMTWSNGTTGSELEAPSGTYIFTATDINLCQSTASVFIPLDCDDPIPLTFLDETSCGATEMPLNGIIHCVPVPGAELYQWNLVDEAVGIDQNLYTMGNNPHLFLSEVNGLLYAMSLEITVRAKVSGQWGDWGPMCMIFTKNQVPPTQLTGTFCGAIDVAFGSNIECQAVPGAGLYEWTFTKDLTVINLETNLNSLTILSSQGFEHSATYDVAVRARAGTQWSLVENVCSISTEIETSVFDISEENTTIFPNPFDGRGFTIQYGTELTGDVDLEIFTAGGKLVARHRLPKGTSKRDINFEQRLSSGMYVIKFKMIDSHKEYKAIVNN